MVRQGERKVCDFINDFADQYLQFQQTNNDLPEKTLAFMLLSACNLNVDKVQLVMAGLPKVITYIEMQNQLTRIFSVELLANNGQQIDTQGASEIFISKNENEDKEDNAVLISNNRQYSYQRDSDNWRRGNHTRGRSQRKSFGRNSARRSSGSYSRGKNPLRRNGERMTCIKCSSVYHFIKDCPDEKQGNHGRTNYYQNDRNRNKISREHEVNFSFLFVGCASSEEDKLQQLINDSKGYAILDSGCANTVAGVEWFTKFTNNLSVSDKMEIKVAPSNETFTFGDGKKVKSMRKVTFPCWSGGTKGSVTADIVDCKIPLLLSRKSMSRVKMIIDFENDTACMQGRTIKLKITSSGHYALPISL